MTVIPFRETISLGTKELLLARLENFPEINAVVGWDANYSGCLLRGSAPGVPIHSHEIFAQLMLSDIFVHSPVFVRQEGLSETECKYIAEKDEHLLFLSLARKKSISVITTKSVPPYANINSNSRLSPKRLDFIQQYWCEDPDAVMVIERALSLYPGDQELWDLYNKGLSDRWGDSPPEERWLAAQYLRCIRPDPFQFSAINELARFFQENKKPFMSALSHIYSLAIRPEQNDIFAMFKDEWQSGIFDPAKPALEQQNKCIVSVLLCTYNRPVQLRQSLASIVAQTYQDFEVIVVNDGGDARAEEVVKEFSSPNVRYFTQEHGGHRAALNHALREARGKYIAYLDDDDIYFPNHLKTLVNAAEAGSLDFVCSRNRWVQGHWEDDQWIEEYELHHQDAEFQIERMRISAFVPDNTILHRRSIVEAVGLFWEEPQRGGEWEYWVRCSRYYPIKRVEAVTCECRVLTASLPFNQPSRGLFFTELWRAYFGSEFGSAVLALGAFYTDDQGVWPAAIERIAKQYVYLEFNIYELLWKIGVQDRSTESKSLLIKMAQQDAVTFSKNLVKYKHLFLGNISNIPYQVFFYLLKYSLSHPLYVFKRLCQLMTE